MEKMMEKPKIALNYLPLKTAEDAVGLTVKEIKSIGFEECSLIIFTNGSSIITTNESGSFEVINNITDKFNVNELVRAGFVSGENAEDFKEKEKKYKEYIELNGDAELIRSFIETNPSDMGHCLSGGAVLNKRHLKAYEFILKNRPLVETIYLEIMGVSK